MPEQRMDNGSRGMSAGHFLSMRLPAMPVAEIRSRSLRWPRRPRRIDYNIALRFPRRVH
ncbi:MAG TPA: hypothetical protein PLX20_09490 [Rhodocyclaceae bacterium]|nr:hypothetical protein [Rhodocyclaceae bacterium]HMV52943.1 hypothetical protein [Rhodocyclaceae bacterium]HMZ83263.1 hypothetical protein [Rhodocyclaceae bacterium]HNA03234.1 hypothetical protein [Rhodocyclaceae bacterium]HNB78516.1 hypothetical protein [Rhodocyclaceae bacterium]